MQNNDLISRKALIELFWDLTPHALGEWSTLGVVAQIEKAPAVDALIPPCKPWDKVWVIDKILDTVNGGFKKTVCEGEIIKLSYNGFTTPMEWLDYRWDSPLVGQTARHDRIDLCLGKTVFLTREEAEAAIAERVKNDA